VGKDNLSKIGFEGKKKGRTVKGGRGLAKTSKRFLEKARRRKEEKGRNLRNTYLGGTLPLKNCLGMSNAFFCSVSKEKSLSVLLCIAHCRCVEGTKLRKGRGGNHCSGVERGKSACS